MFDYKYRFDIAVLGSENVGKKTLAKSNFFESQDDWLSTLGFALAIKTVKIEEITVKLMSRIFGHLEYHWDRTRKINSEIHLRHLHGAIILYDITNSKSIEQITQWIRIVKENAGNIPILLVGNKLDLNEQRKIAKEQIEKIKNEFILTSSIEISVKTGENIENMFTNLTLKILTESEELLDRNKDYYISLLNKAIRIEERQFIDKKSRKMHRKIWRNLHAKKDVSFDEYLNRQKKILRKLFEMRKAISNARNFLEIMTIWKNESKLVKIILNKKK